MLKLINVDNMQRSSGGGPFEAVDRLNGKLLCGRDNVHSCVVRCIYKLLSAKFHIYIYIWRIEYSSSFF